MDSIEAQKIRAVTNAFKKLDIAFAGMGHPIERIAGSHVGLGARMLHDLGFRDDEIIEMIRAAIRAAEEDVD